MNIQVIGATQFAQKLRRAQVAGPKVVLATLFQQAEKIMTVSKADYVPVDKGHLRGSGFVEPPVMTSQGGSVTMGYGGPAAPYAYIVHEDLTVRHTVGQAKYLTIPIVAALQGMWAVLRQRTSDAIKQSFQRLGKVEANLAAGRDVNWGMPLYRGTP